MPIMKNLADSEKYENDQHEEDAEKTENGKD